jgi:hypothetical protein
MDLLKKILEKGILITTYSGYSQERLQRLYDRAGLRVLS